MTHPEAPEAVESAESYKAVAGPDVKESLAG